MSWPICTGEKGFFYLSVSTFKGPCPTSSCWPVGYKMHTTDVKVILGLLWVFTSHWYETNLFPRAAPSFPRTDVIQLESMTRILPSPVAKASRTDVLWASLTPQLCWMTHPVLPVALLGKSSPLASVIWVNVGQGRTNTWAENGQATQKKSWYIPVFSQLCLLCFTLLILVYCIAEV